MNLPKAKIFSLPELIELFCKCWFPRKQQRCIPYFEYGKNLFSKEIWNRNQIEEANDLSSIVDEALHANEYDYDHTYEYPEVLVEEAE